MAFPSTGLVSYWSFDSGWNDQVGTNHLTNVNGVTSVAGKLGNAGDFESSSSQYLSHADPTPLGDEDFTYCLWFKRETSEVTNQELLAKDNDTNRSYQFHLVGTPNQTEFMVWGAGAAVGPAIADTNWHFALCWHDAAANTVNLQIDNGTVNTVAAAPWVPPVPASEFRIGARQYPGFQNYFDGLIDEVGLWRRVLTAGERSDLWNGGAGLAYPTTPAVGPGGAVLSVDEAYTLTGPVLSVPPATGAVLSLR